jgi:general secretion pathway protein K
MDSPKLASLAPPEGSAGRLGRPGAGLQRSHPQSGAALLLAMLIMTLVTTLASGMVWQQYRAIQVEAAERARTQAAWILAGALDWARLILREDGRNSAAVDHLGEPWAVPLAEARLSTFLAADRDNTAVAENESLDAFLSGSITDAQARWNLRRLIDGEGKVVEAELEALQRLCDAGGATGDCASRIAAAVARAWGPAAAGAQAGAIAPKRLAQLAWLGIDSDTIQRLEPWVDVLPDPTAKVNVNTAAAEVIAAAVKGMSLGNAQRLVQERQRSPLRDLNAAPSASFFPATLPRPLTEVVSVNSSYFIVQGRLRLEERVLEERSLVERRNQTDLVVRSRERVNLREGR